MKELSEITITATGTHHSPSEIHLRTTNGEVYSFQLSSEVILNDIRANNTIDTLIKVLEEMGQDLEEMDQKLDAVISMASQLEREVRNASAQLTNKSKEILQLSKFSIKSPPNY